MKEERGVICRANTNATDNCICRNEKIKRRESNGIQIGIYAYFAFDG